MRKTTKRYIVISICVLLGLVVITAGLALIFRDNLLQKAVVRASDKMKRDYNSDLQIKNAHFVSLNEITVDEITLIPTGKDTLLHIGQMKTQVNLGQLFTGDIRLDRLSLENGFIQIVKDSTGRNFDPLLRPQVRKERQEKPSEKTNYAKLAFESLTKLLNLVPAEMQLENVALKLKDEARQVDFSMADLLLKNNRLSTRIDMASGNLKQQWVIEGMANARKRTMDLQFFGSDSSGVQVPYFDERFNLKSGFDSIRVKVAEIEMHRNELKIKGFSSVSNLRVNHRRIADKDVLVEKASFDYAFEFGPDSFAIDSTSTAVLNDIKVHPFAEYSTASDTIYRLGLRIPKMKAQNFLNSLPPGMFTNFDGMQIDGSFNYDLFFEYNKNKPSALVFKSNIAPHGLKIRKFGAANLAKINGPFTYRAIEDGRPQRAVWVSPENIYYTPLESVSPYLKKAVLTTEDPSFYSHRGFITEAFRQSIIQNIRNKRFVRGASTISMQLVKNVFLNREKTLTRKVEEILLVYLLESQRISSKDRMLEVYFNIIEWGPNVYGIGEASMFYFLKHPSELNLNESLFLASIVPKPKKFAWQFDAQATLKPYLVKRNSYLKNTMMRRGWITPEDTMAQTREVVLYGRARAWIKKPEEKVIDLDTLSVDEFDF